jgi:hypothetical protein
VPKKERQAPRPRERDYGPADRQLLESDAAQLFEVAISEIGIDAADERVVDGGPWRAAFEILVSLGLLAPDSAGDRYLARDPAGSQAQVVAPLGQRGAELIAESSRWANAFGALSQTWRRSPVAAHGPFTELRDSTAIVKFLQEAADDATFEVITAQPQTGRGLDQLMASAEKEIEALERGVAIRTLYQHAARRNSATHKYVRMVTQKGAEVRTLDEFFNRLIVFDRALAVIPGAAGTSTAVVIREPSVVAYLVDVFERAWERSRPFSNQELDTMRDIAGEQRAMTIRMLIQGYADPASSKRLGVSPRTFAGYVADLKMEFDAETRFQLGYYMGQRGITGDDPAELKDSQNPVQK